MEPIATSDKIYWHKYDRFYEKFMPASAAVILEIGVFKGDSIRYWRERYKDARIYGLDIVSQKPDWPQDENIKYFQSDQSDAQAYRSILKQINHPIDLLIEDGSHDPLHQKISLMGSLGALTTGSIYILEDIHTSHPNHAYYKERAKKFNKSIFKNSDVLMPLQCLLLIDYAKANSVQIAAVCYKIDFTKSLFSYDEIVLLFNKIKKVNIFKRTVLPDYCWKCKTNDFNFVKLRCSCGTSLYEEADSMTAVIEFH